MVIFDSSRAMLQSSQTLRGKEYMPSWPSWSIKKAAKETGYHPEYLRQLINKEIDEPGTGIIAEKVGNMWLIKIESLDAYIKQGGESGDGRFGPK